MNANTRTATATAPSTRVTGRPGTPAEKRLDALVQTRINPAGVTTVDAAASRARLTRSAWIRAVILRAAAVDNDAIANTESA